MVEKVFAATIILQAIAFGVCAFIFHRREQLLLKQNKDLLDRFMAKSYTEYEVAKHVPPRPRSFAPLSDVELADRERKRFEGARGQ